MRSCEAWDHHPSDTRRQSNYPEKLRTDLIWNYISTLTSAGPGKYSKYFILLFIFWKGKTILHDPDGFLELVKLYFGPTHHPWPMAAAGALPLWRRLQTTENNKSSCCLLQKRPKTFFSDRFSLCRNRPQPGPSNNRSQSLQGEAFIEPNHLKRLLKLQPKLRNVYITEL